MAAVAVYAVWKPKSVFDNVRDEPAPARVRSSDLKRLARHWPIYPALLIWLLWNFAPGSVTPLQYYLQNTLHAEDAALGPVERHLQPPPSFRPSCCSAFSAAGFP